MHEEPKVIDVRWTAKTVTLTGDRIIVYHEGGVAQMFRGREAALEHATKIAEYAGLREVPTPDNYAHWVLDPDK